MSWENVDVVRRAAQAASKHPPDWETLNKLYHREHEFIPLLSGVEGRSYVGASGFLEWQAQRDEMGEWHSDVGEPQAAADGRVVLCFTVRGRGRRSEIPLEREVGSVVTLRNGRIIRTEFFPSHQDALEAVGLRE